jgi:hypothetical protein
LHVGPSELTGKPSKIFMKMLTNEFRHFWELEMPIFHYVGSQKRNGGEQRSQR